PEPRRSRLDPVVKKARKADQSFRPANVFLKKLHHIGAAGDVFGGRVVASSLGSQRDGGVEIARTLKGERMHGSASRHGAGGARRVLDRRDDVVVGSAAAEIPAHPVTDLLRRAGMTLVDAGDTGHDLSGRAVTALERIPLDEGGLQRMKLIALCQAFDSRDLASLDEGREGETRFHALAVHHDRAGAALAETTAFLRSGQMEVLAQR